MPTTPPTSNKPTPPPVSAPKTTPDQPLQPAPGETGAVAGSEEVTAAELPPGANPADSTASAGLAGKGGPKPPADPEPEKAPESPKTVEHKLTHGRSYSDVIDLGNSSKPVNFSVTLDEAELPPGSSVRLGYETAQDPGFVSQHAATSQERTANESGKTLAIKLNGSVNPLKGRYLRIFALTNVGEGTDISVPAKFALRQ